VTIPQSTCLCPWAMPWSSCCVLVTLVTACWFIGTHCGCIACITAERWVAMVPACSACSHNTPRHRVCFGRLVSQCWCRERVCFHSLAGVSRSASTVVAFLMAINGMNLAPALELVQTKRPRANPNRGFHSQLKEMERALVAARENSTPWRRAIAELHNPERVKEQTARRLGDAVKVVHRYRKLRVPEDSIRLAVKKMGLTWTDVEALL